MKRISRLLAGAIVFLTGMSAARAEKPAVAMSFGGSTIALWNDELQLMRPVIEAAGYRFLTDDPQFRVEKQVRDWEAWIASGNVKAIMGWPINAPAMIPVTKRAQEGKAPFSAMRSPGRVLPPRC